MDQDSKQPPQSISDISHLFLSSVRDKQTGNAPRPVRIPPGQRQQQTVTPPAAPAHSLDLTPEEYAEVFGGGSREATADGAEVRIPPITAVISQHLNGAASERVRTYARHLAANGERVGILEVDASEFRLVCFERSIDAGEGESEPANVIEHFDARFMTEALDEMSWDLDRWLVVVPNLRSPEARALLKEINHWAVLSTCDHDGVVSCYRSLKGLVNVGHAKLSLALMETPSEAAAAKVYRKLRSVCLQFLGLDLESEPAVRPTQAVAEHVVAHVNWGRDKAQLASAAHWLVVNEFVAKSIAQGAQKLAVDEVTGEHDPVDEFEADTEKSEMEQETKIEMPRATAPVADASPTTPVSLPKMTFAPAASDSTAAVSEVIDLPGETADENAVLTAILTGAKGEMIECPLRPPMCPEARLAVTRDRGLVLLAVARKGLNELRSISLAYRWLIENRALIGMAVPQLSIDAMRHPRLRLLVDHADATADVLAPMLENSAVSVQAYRKLRWGMKMGLLLEAA